MSRALLVGLGELCRAWNYIHSVHSIIVIICFFAPDCTSAIRRAPVTTASSARRQTARNPHRSLSNLRNGTQRVPGKQGAYACALSSICVFI